MKNNFLENFLKKYDDMPKSFRKGKYVFCFVMVIFAIVNFLIFYVGVNFNSILMAFKHYVGFDENFNDVFEWGIGNFRTMFKEFGTSNSTIGIAVINTLRYFLTHTFLVIPISYFVSYFLFKKVLGYGAFRVIFFLPSIISALVFVQSFKNMLMPFGPLDLLLKNLFGVNLPTGLLSNSETATTVIIIYTVWTGLGMNMILFQGAMRRIPEEILEACEIDGGVWYHELFLIVTPMIWSTISMMIVLAFTGLFNSGGPILLFSEAGEVAGGNGTMTIAFYIWSRTQTGLGLEYPAAIGVFFTFVSLPIVILIRWTVNRFDPEVEY